MTDAIVDGRPILNMRYRYEHVEEDRLFRTADAHTVRARAGWETQPLHGFNVLFDIEGIAHLGAEDFNDTVNGRSQFPVVADPDGLELNQAYINYASSRGLGVRVGRQRIVFDNQRFLGAVGFRQNEQTFDAVRVTSQHLPYTKVEYLFLKNVNRIFGDDSANGDIVSNSHVGHVRYSGLRYLELTAYAYALDLERPLPSSRTFGVRAHGRYPLYFNRDLALLYMGEYAHQVDHANNPRDFSLHYLHLQPGIAIHDLELRMGLEILDGDGNAGFQTPLATLHAFNGVTDQFLSTPGSGLRDLYASVGYKWTELEHVDAIKLGGQVHFFSSQQQHDYLGTEWSAKLSVNVDRNFSATLEHASFQANGFKSDKHVSWVTLQYRF